MSRTSGSRRSSLFPHSAHASGGGQAHVRWPSGHVQIGIWCPHQSWRETHQSGACSSDSIAKRCWLSGWKRTRRSRSASRAGAASPSIAHHHCGETSGSMREWHRSHVPTEWRYGSRFSTSPRSSAHASTRASASFWSRPSNPSAIIRPSGPITVSVSRPWSRPMSKSIGSWPGVTLTAPVPNSGSTRASAIDRHAALDDGDDHLAADRVAVPRIVGVDGDRDVGEHRRRPHRRDRDRLRARRRTGSARTTACRPSRRARPRGPRSPSGGTGTS